MGTESYQQVSVAEAERVRPQCKNEVSGVRISSISLSVKDTKPTSEPSTANDRNSGALKISSISIPTKGDDDATNCSTSKVPFYCKNFH